VPLIAKPGADVDSNRESINISAHFPAHEEYVKVGHLLGSKEIHATPVLNGSALGFGGGIRGVGVDSRIQLNTAKLISLNPVRKSFVDSPTTLNWISEDPHGIFYPRNTNLFVVIKKTTDKNEIWFPFELRLLWDLKVDIRGFRRRMDRWVSRVDKHDGWSFHIAGQHKPADAQKALEDAKGAERDDKIPSLVGLRAAARPWMGAQASTMFTSPTPWPPA